MLTKGKPLPNSACRLVDNDNLKLQSSDTVGFGVEKEEF